jgi:hypothetical protein
LWHDFAALPDMPYSKGDPEQGERGSPIRERIGRHEAART